MQLVRAVAKVKLAQSQQNIGNRDSRTSSQILNPFVSKFYCPIPLENIKNHKVYQGSLMFLGGI